MCRTTTSGFTLLELLLVIALIGVLAAFVVPDFGTVTQAERLGESAYRIESLVAMCRAEAMNESRVYRIIIELDGTMRVRQQVDPLLAPHLFNPLRTSWHRTQVLLEGVWVEAVQLLPLGPPPIQIIDEELAFPEMEIEPLPIQEFEYPILIDFDPDGSCPSLRWVLRDVRGRGLLMTLDGRLGRVTTEDWELVPPDQLERPEPIEVEEEEIYDAEDFKQ